MLDLFIKMKFAEVSFDQDSITQAGSSYSLLLIIK
jgi:hypothetical protein